MQGWTAKALGLLCFSQALCLSGGMSNTLRFESASLPVVRSTALFAIFPSWFGVAWYAACVSIRIGRPMAITGMKKPKIM